jgi:hypothetical protein
MKLGPVWRALLGCLGIFAAVTVATLPAGGTEEDLADPTRQPGGINPADVDWRCSIMAGREDRAYLNCSGFVSETTPSPGAEFILKNPPPPAVRYEEYENARGATRPANPRRR